MRLLAPLATLVACGTRASLSGDIETTSALADTTTDSGSDDPETASGDATGGHPVDDPWNDPSLWIWLRFDSSGAWHNDGSMGGDMVCHDGVCPETEQPGVAWFDGHEACLRFDDNGGFDTETITISAWLRPDPQEGAATILAKNNAEGFANDSWRLGISKPYDFSPGVWSFHLGTESGGGLSIVAEVQPLDGWRHVAASTDDESVKLYVDGVLVANGTDIVDMHVNGDPVLVGCDDEADWQRRYHGDLADVRLYGRALDADAILALASESP